MDLDYLLFLQNNVRSEFLTPIMLAVTNLSVSFFMIFVLFAVFWCINKKVGLALIFTTVFGGILNSILKLSFCVYRPWIRNSAIIPPGNAMAGAGGYSFPSGHSQIAMGMYGTCAYWLWNKKRWIAICLALFVLLIGFSRNYLGVHTPQDVVVGFLVGAFSIYMAVKMLENYDRKDKKADLKLVGWGLLLAALSVLYFKCKSYPLDYDSAGKILVDPNAMMKDGFMGVGMWTGFVIGWFAEKHYICFTNEKPVWLLAIRGIIGIVSVYYLLIGLNNSLYDLLDPCWRRLVVWFLVFFYVNAVYPAIFKLCRF